MRLNLEAMTSHVGDVDEAIFICDRNRSPRGAEFTGDLLGLSGGGTDCIRYGKVEGKVFNIPRVVFQLQLRSISKRGL